MAQQSLDTALRNGVKRWALRRQTSDVLPATLSARRIYILPTRAGWSFAVLIVVMFIAGMNYGNGLALLFTFWLTAFALVAMVQTQRNLAGTQLLTASAAPAFAGEKVAISIRVATRGAAADLALSCEDSDPAPQTPTATPTDELLVRVNAKRRGLWQSPPLELSSTAPFGLFRTWTWLKVDIRAIVYPRPAGDLPLPESAGGDGGSANMAHTQDELAWLRDFRDGDSPRQVAWKAYARGAPLLVREYRGYATASRDFDFTSLRSSDVEGRLSQLTRWCVDAAARGEQWTLRLPEALPMTGTGQEHLEDCLQKLALHGLQRPSA